MPVCRFVLAFLLVAESSGWTMGQAPARTLNSAEIMEKLLFGRRYTEFGLQPEYHVRGTEVWEAPVLSASLIIFHPDSRLVFAGSGGDRNERYIIARTIRVLPSQTFSPQPPTITWQYERAVTRSSAPVGKAAPGAAGSLEGGNGGPGTDGLSGNPGYPGRSAPTLYVVVGRIEGGALAVDLKGEAGGSGGEGQQGGEGGFGRTGRNAVANVLGCLAAGGNGGTGGPGGAGGRGGTGGRGGNGGTFILAAPVGVVSRAAQAFRADVSPGPGGTGGGPGAGGAAGQRGLGGSGSGPCAGGAPGSEGKPGPAGTAGEEGPPGVPGVFGATALTDQQLRSLGLLGVSAK